MPALRHASYQALIIAGCLFALASPVSAEWLGSIGGGISHSNNYSLQNGNYSNIAQSRISRTGTEFSGAASWQDFGHDGGVGIDARALLDRATDTGNRISSLGLSVNRVIPLSPDWLVRFNAGISRYRDDDYLQNGFDGYSLSATAGYFSPEGDGFDLKLGWRDENHDQDIAASYRTRRSSLGIQYFFAARPDQALPGISLAIQNHDSTEARRDASSLLASIMLERIRLGRHTLALSLNWRQDDYDLPYTSLATDPGGMFGGGSGMTGGLGGFFNSGGTTTTQARSDRQWFASASVQHPLGQHLRASLTASAGRYTSVTGDQDFFNLYARLRWFLH